MTVYLIPTSAFSIFVLAIGLGLILSALSLMGWLMVHYRSTARPAELDDEATALTLEDKTYIFYRTALANARQSLDAGKVSVHDTYIQSAAILRAALTLASQRNCEVMTVKEIALAFPHAPGIAGCLDRLENAVYSDESSSQMTITPQVNADLDEAMTALSYMQPPRKGAA